VGHVYDKTLLFLSLLFVYLPTATRILSCRYGNFYEDLLIYRITSHNTSYLPTAHFFPLFVMTTYNKSGQVLVFCIIYLYNHLPLLNFLCSCSEIPIYIPIPTYTFFAEFTPLTECLLPSGAFFLLQASTFFPAKSGQFSDAFFFCRKHTSYILAVNVLSIPLTLNRIVCLPDVIFFHLQQSIVYNILSYFYIAELDRYDTVYDI